MLESNKEEKKSNSKIKELYFKIPELIRMVFWALVIIIPLKIYLISPHMVVGSSMEPSFYNGDYLLVSKTSTLERGDIIIIKPPTKNGFFDDSYIKRLIGLPGDTIKIENKELFIKEKGVDNFHKVKEPYIKNNGLMYDKEVLVKEGEYYIMGDNRGNSKDSRIVGVFNQKDLIGEPVFRVFGFTKDNVTDKDTHFKLYFENHPEKYEFNF